MVPDTPQVADVLFGERGCAKAALKGKTIVDMSSISPIETKRFAQQVRDLGRIIWMLRYPAAKSARVKARSQLWSAAMKTSLPA